MDKITPKERETTILEGGTPDRVPLWSICGMVASHTLGYVWKDVRFDAKLCVELSRKYARMIGTDILAQTCIETNAMFMDLPGMEVKLVDDNYSNVMTHYFVEPEDVEKKEFYDPSDPNDAVWLWKGALSKVALMAEVENDYLTNNVIWGIMTTAGHLRNVENLMMDIMLEPELAHKAMARAAELVDGIARVGLERGCDTVMLGDPTSSGSLVSGEMFAEYNTSLIKKMTAAYKKDYGAPTYLHICGESLPVANEINNLGVAMFSFDYLTDIVEVKKIIGNKTIIAGNLDPMNVVWMGTPDVVMSASKKCIENAEGSRFILATGCETPRDAPIENMQAMHRAVETYGRY